MANTNELLLLTQIRDALLGVENLELNNTPLTPSLDIVTASGTIASGAKFISIGIRAGTGTILGTSVNTSIAVIEFPYTSVGYQAIAYTIDPGGEFVIVTGR